MWLIRQKPGRTGSPGSASQTVRLARNAYTRCVALADRGRALGSRLSRRLPAAQLARAARLIRDFHDAVTGFVPPADAQWQANIPADRPEIIAHHDLAPWNLVIGDQWAFIDWDNAAPGSRLWDLAYAIHGFVPLSADPQIQPPDTDSRLRAFVDAYGLDDEAQRRQLVALLGPRARSMYQFLADQAAKTVDPWVTLWRDGHGDVWRNDADYIDQHLSRWHAALLR
jgi:hypothetical protein